MQALGRRCILVAADAGRRASHDEVAELALAELGGLDIWINNAARLLVRPFLETTEADWAELLAVNLLGYVHGCRAAIARMLEHGGGRIVNVRTSYCTAKGAVKALTQVLAVEFGARGIAVNALAPGATDTPINAHAYTDSVRAIYEARIPLGRIANADEVGDAVAFLASDAARYVNGAELICDGGIILNGSVDHARG